MDVTAFSSPSHPSLPSRPPQLETRRLLAALFHLSSDPRDAWARVLDSLLHGLAMPDAGEAGAKLGGIWEESGVKLG